MGLSTYCSYLALLLFLAFILTMSPVVWGVPDKTSEIHDDQNGDDDTAAEIGNLFRFKSEIGIQADQYSLILIILIA